MTVVIMTPARALSADIGSVIFANHKGSITSVGIKQNKDRLDSDEANLFPLLTRWNKQLCHWPEPHALAMFGFNEAM